MSNRLIDPSESVFLHGPRKRQFELFFALKVFWEFVRGFRALHFVGPCVTVFGSARFKDGHRYYEVAQELGQKIATELGMTVMTGGGPGIMEAANRGAFDVGAKSIGLNITLPAEQLPNPYITPELCFQFRYFALRKLHFLLRAKALVVFPGGFGTLDELFDALTLRQTNRMQQIPIIMYGRAYWDRVIDLEFLANEGVIDDRHLQLVDYAETPVEAWDKIVAFYAPGGPGATG